MANHCRTICTITGPDAEVERLKQTCFVTAPPIPGYADYGDGIDFTRAEWRAVETIYRSEYCCSQDGQHRLWMESAWRPPLAALEKVSALFPGLTFELSTTDEFGHFFIKGPIRAGVADLHDDAEAMEKYVAWRAG